MGRQCQGMGSPEVCKVPEGNGEQGKMEETGCKFIYGAPTTLAVKGKMMMMMMMCCNQCGDMRNAVHAVLIVSSFCVI